MNRTGSNETAIAPTTIFVLNRAPKCSLLLSAQSRSVLRVRISPKTRSAAVMKLETAYSVSASRQFFGSKGTSSEPNVNTAASSSVRKTPPITKRQRCLESRRLIRLIPRIGRPAQGVRSAKRSRFRSRHFSSSFSGDGRFLAQGGPKASLRHDSHRTEPSQEIHLSLFSPTCPCEQVLAISEPSLNFRVPSLPPFAMVSAGCKPAGSAADVRPFGRNIN